MKAFTLLSVNGELIDKRGVYRGRGPLQAARKAFNMYCRKQQIGECSLEFVIQNVESGKKNFYIGSREKLSEPREIIRKNGTKYLVHHQNLIKKCAKLKVL